MMDLYKNILRGSDSGFQSGPSSNVVSGSAAGCTTLVIIYPLDIAHTRLAADIDHTEVPGHSASLQGMAVHWGLYFARHDERVHGRAKSKRDLASWNRWLVAQEASFSRGAASDVFRSTGWAAILVLCYAEFKKFISRD
ncbi:hypothetical protein MLD38_006486 [Melastoma candidum]|uniref:Uncharacterized protein n=1 Tax=Melastoma candidum TaxID=119954 RepID=A0ACB9RMR7_9MYRT|nr:hypothetical protein MLD38_006486 [Melastoma candidum]